jgi:3-hydroxyisobutyrate dehydrogenase-like beta-hydroxyacid dehydrogenase
MAERIGFIGLGTMGLRMATNIAHAGFDLTVYDRREEPLRQMEKLGAKVASSPSELAQDADVIEIAVAPETEVENVILGPEGVLASARAGTVIDSHSTIFPSDIQRIAAEAERVGVHVLDAQMSGGYRGVENRSLCFMVGGDPAILERCRPIMSASGTAIYHLGGIGAGAAAKIAQNTILAGTLAATAEGFAMAQVCELDLEVFQDVIRASAAQSHVADDWLQTWGIRVQPDTYQWILESALRIGKEHNLPLPGSALTKELLPRILGPRPTPNPSPGRGAKPLSG